MGKLIISFEHFGSYFCGMWVSLKWAVFRCWDQDTDLKMNPYCECLKWPPLALQSRRQSRLHLPLRLRHSSHGARHARRCKRTVLVRWKEPMAPKLSRFEPTGLSYLGRHAGKVPYTQPKPKTIDYLKVALQTVWKALPQEHINKAWQTSQSTWLPVLLPIVVTSIICSKGIFPSLYPHFSTKTGSFQSDQHTGEDNVRNAQN